MGKTCACGLATITWYFSKMGCGHCKSHEWWHNRSKRLWPLDVTRLLCEKKHGYEASFTMVCIRYTLRMPWYSTRHQYIIPTNQPIQQLCSIKCLQCWLLHLYIWVGSGNETIKSLAILLQAHSGFKFSFCLFTYCWYTFSFNLPKKDVSLLLPLVETILMNQHMAL